MFNNHIQSMMHHTSDKYCGVSIIWPNFITFERVVWFIVEFLSLQRFGVARTTRPPVVPCRPRRHEGGVQGSRRTFGGERRRTGAVDGTTAGLGTGVRDNQSRWVTERELLVKTKQNHSDFHVSRAIKMSNESRGSMRFANETSKRKRRTNAKSLLSKSAFLKPFIL